MDISEGSEILKDRILSKRLETFKIRISKGLEIFKNRISKRSEILKDRILLKSFKL